MLIVWHSAIAYHKTKKDNESETLPMPAHSGAAADSEL